MCNIILAKNSFLKVLQIKKLPFFKNLVRLYVSLIIRNTAETPSCPHQNISTSGGNLLFLKTEFLMDSLVIMYI